jgi:MoxR-like ATPase
LQALSTATPPGVWWEERRARESQQQKYFHYLLSRFTQPEELFGPIEISLLRQGILARVNFGLLTGPGVRAAFLDEVFKASSSILNTLLTLTQERQYFNFGGMVQSDLLMLIAASNELPGGFLTGSYGAGSGLEDFQTLYAFLDRFPIRLLIPVMSGTKKIASTSQDTNGSTTELEEATRRAINRERQRFTTGANFHARGGEMPCINDLLLLGRACMQQAESPLPATDQIKFFTTFMKIATHLQPQGTKAQESIVTWTISPRKLKALYKVGVAHALVRSPHSSVVSELNDKDLRVFDLIWDSPMAKDDLERQVSEEIRQSYFR